jgi:hypothetical protein
MFSLELFAKTKKVEKIINRHILNNTEASKQHVRNFFYLRTLNIFVLYFALN